MASVWTILLSVGIVFFVAYISSRPKIPKGLRAVPGPKGIPVLGSALEIGDYPEKTYMKWAREYGELFQVRLGWNNWIFVNSEEAVKEILDKQSAKCSSRPSFPVAQDIVSGGRRILFMRYSEQWRRIRTIIHQLFTPRMSATFRPSQLFESKQLTYDLLENNKNQTEFYTHTRRYATSVIMTSTYGRRVPTWENDDVREIFTILGEFAEASSPTRWWAEILPPLSQLPEFLQWWRPEAMRFQERQNRVWMGYWQKLKQKIADGTAPVCFVKQFAESDYESKGIDELQAAYTAGTMIEAGSETTSATLNSCILYLCANPQVQKKAQEELDRVLGGRSPTFEDEDSLPYCRAIVKEILRLRPVANIGSPRRSDEDIVYKDMFIPAGTNITLFQYAIQYNPGRWTNPEAFDPSRYLDYPLRSGDYAGIADPMKRDHFSFGAGRRICPGMHLAENSLFITISRILWAFDILPGLDENGKEIKPDTENYEKNTSLTSATPFKARFVVRSEEKRKTILNEWKTAQKTGYTILGDKIRMK